LGAARPAEGADCRENAMLNGSVAPCTVVPDRYL